MIALLILLGLIVVLFFAVVGIYNGLVTLRNGFKNAFAQIDVQLKRRHDLIPNLVETAKGYMKHESGTFEAVIQARNMAMAAGKSAALNPADTGAMAGLMGAEGMLTGALGKLFALSEAYPDLKANQTMMQLSQELSETENKIAAARQDYNNQVTLYNTKRETVPANLIANTFNFSVAVLFEVIDPDVKEAPNVSFD